MFTIDENWVSDVVVLSVDNIDVPTHQAHLQSKDGVIGTVIGEDKLNCIAVCNPDKSLTKQVMAALVHSVVTSKTFAQMGVQAYLIAAAAS